jgi:flagellar biogenesis protein FliO
MEWILVKTLLSLAAVLALMLGVVALLRRYVAPPRSAASSAVAVELLGQRSLHPKRSVVVLKVMQKVLVVAMSEQGLQTLATIDDPESLAAIEEKLCTQVPAARWMLWRGSSPGGAAPAAGTFAGQLQDTIRSFLTRRMEQGGGAPGAPLKSRRGA